MPVLEVANKATTLAPINPSAGGVQAARSKEAAIRKREVVREQGRALEESCEKGAIRDTLLAARWHRMNLWLGVSSAVAATLAAFVLEKGEVFLKDLPHGVEIASVFALISAILTSTLTFLAPSEKAGAYHHFSNKLRALRDRVRSLIEIDCVLGNKDAALCDKFERMVREKSEIVSSHPIVPHWAYDKAYVEMKKKIEHKQSLQKRIALEAQNTGRGGTSFPTDHVP